MLVSAGDLRRCGSRVPAIAYRIYNVFLDFESIIVVSLLHESRSGTLSAQRRNEYIVGPEKGIQLRENISRYPEES